MRHCSAMFTSQCHVSFPFVQSNSSYDLLYMCPGGLDHILQLALAIHPCGDVAPNDPTGENKGVRGSVQGPLHANRLDSPAGLVLGQGAIFTASPMSHLRSVPAQAAVSFWGKSRKGRDQGRGSDQHGTLDMVGHGWTSLQAEHFIKLSMFCAGTCLSGADLAAQITGRLK